MSPSGQFCNERSRRRDGRVAECASLLMMCPWKRGPRVRIPLSPHPDICCQTTKTRDNPCLWQGFRRFRGEPLSCLVVTREARCWSSVSFHTLPDLDGDSQTTNDIATYTCKYDAFGNQTLLINPPGRETRWEFDVRAANSATRCHWADRSTSLSCERSRLA